MATAETSTGTGSGSQEVGKVLIVYGKVKAISSAGTERVLGPNSPIFAYDRIITESDGKVSIMLNDPAQTQIDIGRMSDIHIDEDVFGGATQDEIADVAAEVEEIQEAILSEDFDPTVELEAAAAGGTGGAGGGIPVPEFDRVTYDGEITSGAETRGIPGDTIDPLPGIDEGAEETSIPTIEADSGEVWEAGLPDGSAPGAYNTTTAGNLTITHSDPGVDATALLEIQDAGGDWVPVTADNTLVVGQYGDLYVDMDGAWRYEMTDNTLDHPDNVFDDGDTDRMADDPVMDNFATRVTDTSGDMTDADGIDPTEVLTIAVYDDGPSAVDDETTGQEDQTVTYNVMTNNDGTSDTPGADDAILTGAVLQPAYEGTGEVTFEPNGEVTFDPVPGFDGPKVVIDYTLTGGDQDLANATLTILYPGGDSEPTIIADEGEVWESALPDGSGGGTTTDSGQLIINTGNDTVQLLEVQDVNSDWIGITADNTLVQGEYGELRVDMDGSWEYEIFENTLDHPDFILTDGDGDRDRDDQVFDQFATRVTDSDGDQASAILTIAVNDDGPEAVDDFSGPHPQDTTVTYNVMANDVPGADDVTTLTGATLATPNAGVVTGFTSSGNITFDPNPNFSGTVQIDYTITDADNDNSAASLFITYEQPPPPPPRVNVNNITVPEGDVAVFDVNVFNAAANDTLSLSLSDGTATSPADYDSPARLPNFQYKFDNEVTWSDVSGPIDIPTGNSSLQVRTDTVPDDIPDSGETFNLTATINNADGPNPSDIGVATIVEEEPPRPLNTPGEVEESDMDLTQDAGELAASSVEGTTPNEPDESDIKLALNLQPGFTPVAKTGSTTYGSYQIFADGTYTYTLVNPADQSGGPITDVINYTVEDAGGNTLTNTLTINIVDDAPIADADTDSVASGFTATGNVVTGIENPNVDANVTPFDGVPDTDGADGWNTGLPTNDAVVGVVAGTALVPTTDGTGVGAANAITTSLGTLTLNADGIYSYVAKPNVSGTDTFTYTVQDGDGSTDFTTLTITVTPPPEPINTNGEVEESDMDLTQDAGELAASSVEGTTPNEPDESDIKLALNLQPGFTPVAKTGSTTYGSYQIFADGTYTYTLVNPADQSGGPITDVINYTVEDAGGNTLTNTLTINIVDDAPIADADTDSVASGFTATGNVVTGIENPNVDANVTPFDGVPDTDGADGWNTGLPTNGPVVGVVAGTALVPTSDGTGVGAPNAITTSLGTLTLNTDGTYSYVAKPNVSGTDTFTYTVQDGDGSTDFTTLTITVTAEPGPLNTNGEVEESDMDLTQNAGELAASSVEGTTPNEPDESDIKLALNLQPGFTPVAKTGSTTYGSYQIFADGTYTYTLVNPADQSGGPITDVINYTVEDAGGNTITNTLTINIVDDAPIADADTDSVASGFTATGNVVTGVENPNVDANVTPFDGVPDTDGADGWNTGLPTNDAVVGVVAGTALVPTTDGTGVGAANAITTSLGTLILNADGIYSYVALPNVGGTDTFTYTVQDDDGSTDFTTLTITVTPPPEPINTNGEVEESDMDLTQDAGELAASSVEGTTPAGPDESDIKLALNLQPGFTAVAKTGTTANGSYEIFADNTYTYTLVNAADHSGGPVADIIPYNVQNGVFTVTNTLTINIVDDAPLTTDFGTNTNIFFHSEDAGFDNMVGVYKLDTNDNPVFLEIIVHSTDALDGAPDELVYTTGDPDAKLFLVADGADHIDLNNMTLRFAPGTAQLQVSTDNGANWTDYDDTDVFFMDADLNPETPVGEPHFAAIPESQTTGENELPGWQSSPPALDSIPDPGPGQIVLIGIEDINGDSTDPDLVPDHDFNDAVLYATEGFVVHEDGLQVSAIQPDAGTKAGDVSHPVSLTGNFFADGNIIPGADLPTTILVGGHGSGTFEITPGGGNGPYAAISTALGNQLLIDHDGTWTYTLRTNTDHPDTVNTEFADQVQETFTIDVTDSDLSPAVGPTINLVININDDGPIAVDDDAGEFSQAQGTPVITYNVITNADGTSDTPGADGATLTDAVLTVGAGTIDQVNPNGVITFTPDAGFSGDVQIDYTITDGDFDEASASLMFTLLDDGGGEEPV